MGLSLITQDRESDIRVGSYSSVHILRAFIVALVARHFTRKGETALAQSALEMYPYLDAPDNAAPMPHYEDFKGKHPDYSTMPEGPLPLNIEGLRKFVNHSDCEDAHTAGDVADIAALFQMVINDIPEQFGDNTDDTNWVTQIMQFFIDADDRNQAILYV